MSRAEDFTGRRIGRLTILHRHEQNSTGNKPRWVYACDCGNTGVAISHNLRNNSTLSCGCLAAEQTKRRLTTHDLSRSKIYEIWHAMHRRVRAVKHYAHVTVDLRWDRFEHFLEDMGDRPSPGHQLDRIDPHGPYTKSNCRWLFSRKANARNRRNTIMLTIDGVTKPLAQWAEEHELLYSTVFDRYKRGWSPEDCLKPTSIRHRRKSHPSRARS